MSATHSPDPASQLVVSGDEEGEAPVVANGHLSPDATGVENGQASPVPSIEADEEILPDAPAGKENGGRSATNGGDEDGSSEAETLIDSPVKKKEAERQRNVVKSEKPQKTRIGSLPVPGDDDEDGDSTASAMESREISIGDAKEDVEMMDDDSDKENGSELSSARSSASNVPSRASSRSRALSERPLGNGTSGSPNPRKRKHRASSMSLPSSKRQSMDPPKRTRLRGMHSEGTGGHMERSPSPKRGHRRAVSTQSGLDGTAESSGRKRKLASTYPGGRESKSVKSGWEESDASSEATSRGQDESKRPQRGVGRSTSTPGRPGVREHKRHVNKYGFTRLAEACEDGDVDQVRECLEKDRDAIEVPEFAGNRPLQIAALNGNSEVVSYLIEQGCQIDCANGDKDTPLIDAAENGHLEVVNLLLAAGVDPLRQNVKGQQALDVITDETDDAGGIRAALHKAIDHWNSSEAKQRREQEEEQRHRAGPSKELHLMSRTYENLLKLVQNNDRTGVSEFLAARVPVDNVVIAAAAKTGDLYLVNMLLAEMTEKKATQKPEKPMLAVLGTSHFEMVKALTELENFNPLWRTRAGKSWPELAEDRNGPMWRQEREMLQRLYDKHGGFKDRRSSSPVTKRDGAKRRFQQAEAEDDSDGEQEGSMQRKRKNGRRLMSKKAMRAASGMGALSDSSEEGDEDEADEATPTVDTAAAAMAAKEEVEAEMKPPESPNTTRRRLRSKSISSPAEMSPKSLRKRSNSTRDVAEKALPTLDEKGEEKDSGSDGIVLAGNEKVKKERADEAKFRLDEAKRLDEQRKQEEEAEAEIIRVKKELERMEEERKAEEERVAAEARAAEETKRREEEAEQTRKAEEERKQRERETEEAKKRFVSEMLQLLPTTFSHVLDPDSGFNYEGDEDENLLLRQFTPLLAFATSASPSDIQVLNLQAAPLLGKIGLEVFGSSEGLFRPSLAEQWDTFEPEDTDLRVIDQMLARMSWASDISTINDDEEMQDAEVSFEDELKRTAEQYTAFASARKLLHENISKIGLRRVRLQDVLSNLHYLIKEATIDVEFVSSLPNSVGALMNDSLKSQDFVEKMKGYWDADGCRPPLSVLEGKMNAPVAGGCVSLTDVMVVHDKRP